MRIGNTAFLGTLVALTTFGVTACGSSHSETPAAAASTGGTGGTSATGGSAGSTSSATGVTFHEQLEPLLQAHCQECHFTGGIAPFPLITYADAQAEGPLLLARTADKTMPPWGALPVSTCAPRLPYQGDNHLTDDEIQLVNDWYNDGMLEGDPAKAPPPKTDFGYPGLMGVTDTLMTAAPFSVPASENNDIFRCFVLDPQFASDTWIDGLEVVPGNNLVVHHALVFTDPDRESLTKTLDASNSYECFGSAELQNTNLAAAWAPGAGPLDFKENTAMQITKQSLLVMQVHYHPRVDSDQTDQTVVNLRRSASTSPDYIGLVQLFGNADGTEPADSPLIRTPQPDDPATGPKFRIEANTTTHREDDVLTFPATVMGYPLPELHVLAAGTHAHWVGNDISINVHRTAATATDPQDECLVETPQWDFNWQRAYWYDATIAQTPALHAGDQLTVHCAYNNTMKNQFVARELMQQHLTSPQDVFLGESTQDEMCLGVVVLAYKNPLK